MLIYTIGFSKKSLRQFIDKLRDAGVEKLIDVRLNNTSQLAGYAKKQDLQFVLELVKIQYEHHPELAPTEKLLKDYKNKKISWAEYETIFKGLLNERNPLEQLKLNQQPNVICLLCSEETPQNCHRRLVAEYIQANKEGVEIRHL